MGAPLLGGIRVLGRCGTRRRGSAASGPQSSCNRSVTLVCCPASFDHRKGASLRTYLPLRWGHRPHAGHHLASAALLARPCILLTLSELSFTVREVFSASDRTRHEPVGRCVATIYLHSARVRPQGCTRDH